MSRLCCRFESPGRCGPPLTRPWQGGEPGSPPLQAGARRGSFASTPFIVWLLAIFAPICLLGVSTARAEESPPAPSFNNVHIGFGQEFKLGYWTPVWVDVEGGSDAVRGDLEIVTQDGDGVQTSFQMLGEDPVEVAAGSKVRLLRYVKFGRGVSSASVRLRDKTNVLAQQPLSSLTKSQAVDSKRDLIVSVGADAGVQDALKTRRRAAGELEKLTVVVTDADRLPDHWLGYESVTTLVLPTGDADFMDSLKPGQIQAIVRWVEMGGFLVISVGRNGERLLKDEGPLTAFVPGRLDRVRAMRKTDNLEMFASEEEQPLDILAQEHPLRFSSLVDIRGTVEASEGQPGQGPTVVRRPLGFGQVLFIAVDLDAPPVSQWNGRARLVARLISNEQEQREDRTSLLESGQVVHEGYDDMVGQLRTALDQFNGVAVVDFTTVAALTVIYILLIGPADYFLLRRFVRRMEITWVTFPLTVVLFCTVAGFLAFSTKGQQLRVNQVELVEIDAETSSVRGTVWAHLYSPRADRYDLSFQPELSMPFKSQGSVLSWQGLPGEGLGGLQSGSGAQLFNQVFSASYAVDTWQDGPNGFETAVKQMPLQVSSTKSLSARWWGRVGQAVKSDLYLDEYDRLHGQLTNPLDVDLMECVVSHGTSTYRLNRKLNAGETIDIDGDGLRERSLAMHLTRRTVDESAKQWDPAGGDIPRILEVMMFYYTAGGRTYTNLSNRYQPYIDMSRHLPLDVAILTGWTQQHLGHLKRGDESLTNDYDRTWTFYRIVMPVEKSR